MHDEKLNINRCTKPLDAKLNGYVDAKDKILACAKGFYLDKKSCKQCATKNCLECSGAKEDTCTMCSENYTLKNGKCVPCKKKQIFDPEMRTCNYYDEHYPFVVKETHVLDSHQNIRFDMNEIYTKTENEGLIVEFDIEFAYDPVKINAIVEISSLEGVKRQHVFNNLPLRKSRHVILRTKSISTNPMKATIRIIPENNHNINLYKIRNGKYIFDKIHGKHDSSIDYKITEKVKNTHKIDYGTRVKNYF